MNWKEFFKPTKYKITLTIIILILSAFYLRYGIPCPTDYPSAYCGKLPVQGIYILFWPFMIFFLILNSMSTLPTSFEMLHLFFRVIIFILGILFNLLYFYTISTLIVKLIQKLNK